MLSGIPEHRHRGYFLYGRSAALRLTFSRTLPCSFKASNIKGFRGAALVLQSYSELYCHSAVRQIFSQALQYCHGAAISRYGSNAAISRYGSNAAVSQHSSSAAISRYGSSAANRLPENSLRAALKLK